MYVCLVDTLQRHLIRSLCADMCDMILRELETSASARTGQLSIEERSKIIQKMPEPNRTQLAKVNESLNGKVRLREPPRTSTLPEL